MDNIYIKLELFLDPPIINPGELENELKNKLIPDWNKKINNSPKYKVMVEKAREYIQRDLASLGLKNCADIAKQEKNKSLNSMITELERDGILEESEYKLLTNKFPCFTENTIKKRLHLPITPGFKEPEKPTSDPNAKEISIDEMETIAADLKIIENGNYKDFYELLRLNRACTTKTLYDKAKEELEKNRRVSNKTGRTRNPKKKSRRHGKQHQRYCCKKTFI
ncbi:MAG: hypothetical protein LBT05_06890 [Planctomycetaceae bacterium]|jgi:hypothetical protein|nr:hypothetical protein [Planctomycetaceae bacterium]